MLREAVLQVKEGDSSTEEETITAVRPQSYNLPQARSSQCPLLAVSLCSPSFSIVTVASSLSSNPSPLLSISAIIESLEYFLDITKNNI
jgi:hypothetical protein